jgi:outer membrane protein assembly factor BamC
MTSSPLQRPSIANASGRHAWQRWSALALATLVASGCSVLEEDKIDYKSAKRVSTLEVPPDLTQLSRESRYLAPGTTVTASGYQVAQSSQPTGGTVAASTVGDVRIERAGNQRWLVVERAPEKVWPAVRDFWQEAGFLLTLDQENLGILETDWAENRAKLPQDIIRSTIGKVFDGLYSTGERDKFRTRIERTEKGGSEIYISHRGMVEVYNSDRKDQTVWQPRPADVELEAEFLRRLMVKLGVSQEQTKALLASGAQPQVARLGSEEGRPVVLINEGFDRAWRRVGLALDRTGFTVEDRDRTQGLYFVRYVAPDPTIQTKTGFLSGWFGPKPKEATPARYRIQVKSADNQTKVSVLDAQGKPETSSAAQSIAKVIADDLK